MTFVYLNSDRIGTGDENLGRKLMGLFLAELAASDAKIDAVGCVNDAIYLTTGGSAVLKSLRSLEAKGTRIVSCGTCLDFLQRSDFLAVGQIGSMAQTVELLTNADRIIAPC